MSAVIRRDSGYGGQVDWLFAISLSIAIIVVLVGIDFTIGAVSIRAHGPARVLLVAIILFAIRWRIGIVSVPAWLTRITLLTLISGSVVTWFRFLLSTIGGADSYGYVSASHMLASGRLIDPAPIAEWLTAPNRWRSHRRLVGLGARWIRHRAKLPIGASVLMRLFTLAGGQQAVFLVAPAMALLTLTLVYRATRDWFDEDAAMLAVAILAWNPVFVTYAKQPMSDVPATAWVTLAIVLAMQRGPSSAFGAGLAAGAAVITRPALLIAAATIPFLSLRGEARYPRFVMSGLGAAIGVAIQMAIQAKLFGSPFVTGYGRLRARSPGPTCRSTWRSSPNRSGWRSARSG